MKKIILSAILCVCAVAVFAQTKKPYKESDYQACYTMFEVSGVPAQMQAVLNQKLQNPMFASCRDTVKAFLEKYVSYNVMKKEMAELYLAEFTVAEINEITAFYSTPIGKKLARKQSVLAVAGTKLGERKVMEHQSELILMIQQSMKK